MENNTLGKRIKEARLAKKMTQSEVVGDFITRNMLSQIESGSATPSVKTLEYLCKVLELFGVLTLKLEIFAEIEPVYYICSVKETNFVRLVKKNNEFSVRPIQWFS